MPTEDNKAEDLTTNTSKSPSETPAKKLPRRPVGSMSIVEITSEPLVKSLQEKFGTAILEANEINSQKVLTVEKNKLYEILSYLRNEANPNFNMLTDLTAVHWPERTDKPFEIVYQIYALNEKYRLRIKVNLAEEETVKTVTGLWGAANWLEREVYDLFGVRFDEHPDLRRILLPNGWSGHPLRKEYPLVYKDNEWVEQNLQIRQLPLDGDFTGKFE
jgi:NADH-quinone oxidoreductase subunit C